MSSTESTPETSWPEPITPAKRKRLQQCFEYGRANIASGNFDYALEMFVNSLAGDPGNLVYVKSFMEALSKKHKDKKGGSLSGLKGAGVRRTWKKARAAKDWENLVKSALELLKLNPWDTQVLVSMAEVCEQCGEDETQLYFLKAALDTNPKDAEVNRLAALALTRIGQFEQAIVCWHRVEQARPGHPEAPKEIAELTVLRQMPGARQEAELKARAARQQAKKGGGARPAPRSAAKQEEAEEEEQKQEEPKAAAVPEPKEEEPTPEARLRRAIDEQPEQVGNYLELSDLYLRERRFDEAEQTLRRAVEATGGEDVKLRKRLEDARLRRYQRQYETAAERARKNAENEEAQQLAKRAKAELNRVELEVYTARCRRAPEDAALQFELGLRLKRAGKFDEAAQSLQQAREGERQKAAAHLELGECFQHLKQYRQAMSSYEQAIESSETQAVGTNARTGGDEETYRLALYRAGVLAMGLKEWDAAERWLTELAGVDFGYKDVAARLDKIAKARNSK
jgi:tetratricopeptide (TPR) repeat protein